jgi:hypothetical protein
MKVIRLSALYTGLLYPQEGLYINIVCKIILDLAKIRQET